MRSWEVELVGRDTGQHAACHLRGTQHSKIRCKITHLAKDNQADEGGWAGWVWSSREKSDTRVALHFVSHGERVLILVLTHHPLPECFLQAVTRMRGNQKERQSSVEKGCRGGHRGKLSLQAANGALRKWLPTVSSPAGLCQWQCSGDSRDQAREREGKALCA